MSLEAKRTSWRALISKERLEILLDIQFENIEDPWGYITLLSLGWGVRGRTGSPIKQDPHETWVVYCLEINHRRNLVEQCSIIWSRIYWADVWLLTKESLFGKSTKLQRACSRNEKKKISCGFLFRASRRPNRTSTTPKDQWDWLQDEFDSRIYIRGRLRISGVYPSRIKTNPLLLAVGTAAAGVRISLMSCIQSNEQVIISMYYEAPLLLISARYQLAYSVLKLNVG